MADGKRKKSLGKPRKAPEDSKKNLVKVRVTDEQKRKFASAANAAGLDLSSWLRALGVRAVKEEAMKS